MNPINRLECGDNVELFSVKSGSTRTCTAFKGVNTKLRDKAVASLLQNMKHGTSLSHG
jgi:hypothetical protein